MIKHKPILELEELKLTSEAKSFLREIAKWSLFLAVFGFVGVIFLLVLGVFNSFFTNNFTSPFMDLFASFSYIISIVYVILAVMFFFPNYYLLQFSKKLKIALETKEDDTLTHSLEMLKSNFKFYGVFIIIMLSIYAILFVFYFLGFLI